MEEILLPPNDIVSSFKAFNGEDKLKILEVGIKVFNLIKKTEICWSDEKIKLLLKEEKEKTKQSIGEIKQSCETKIQQSVKIITEDKLRLEKMLSEEKDKSRDYWLMRETNIRQQYEESLDKFRQKYEATFIHTQNSTILGQDGENYTFSELNRNFPSCEIEDCRKKSGRGDFIMTDGDFVMMVETKNYKKNVLKPEVEKFYRDVTNNTDIKCAVFVSLKSGICAKPDFHFEVCEGKPILFLHKVRENIQNLILAVRFFKLILANKCIDLSNKEILGKVKNIVPTVKRCFRNQKKMLQSFKKNMETSILNQEATIIELFKLITIKY